jgi:hypothetical protein
LTISAARSPSFSLRILQRMSNPFRSSDHTIVSDQHENAFQPIENNNATQAFAMLRPIAKLGLFHTATRWLTS